MPSFIPPALSGVAALQQTSRPYFAVSPKKLNYQMTSLLSHSAKSTLAFVVSALCVFNCFPDLAHAQAANATTDPAEGLPFLLLLSICLVWWLKINYPVIFFYAYSVKFSPIFDFRSYTKFAITLNFLIIKHFLWYLSISKRKIISIPSKF